VMKKVAETTLASRATNVTANTTSFFVDHCRIGVSCLPRDASMRRADSARRRAALRLCLRNSPHPCPICVQSLRCNTCLLKLRAIRARCCASFPGERVERDEPSNSAKSIPYAHIFAARIHCCAGSATLVQCSRRNRPNGWRGSE
jgi:hypothetical protein